MDQASKDQHARIMACIANRDASRHTAQHALDESRRLRARVMQREAIAKACAAIEAQHGKVTP